MATSRWMAAISLRNDMCYQHYFGRAELRRGDETVPEDSPRHPGFTKDVAVVPFDAASADRFAVVAAALVTRGQPIGLYDTLVAAQALCLGLTVVTNNARRFGRVPGLGVETWT
jgi:predicted nucleic acid-binding protein